MKNRQALRLYGALIAGFQFSARFDMKNRILYWRGIDEESDEKIVVKNVDFRTTHGNYVLYVIQHCYPQHDTLFSVEQRGEFTELWVTRPQPMDRWLVCNVI